ncbi:acyltransferase [Cerasicoccus frondis]|uniref:acyltransferase n=1 Tax=Cerasicoccus frondis TaxID=490090 RepID=UPI0028528A9B|nr:acyltransferase [Cerasicoccus frondis]
MSALSEFRLYLCNFWVNRIPSHTLRNAYYQYVMGFELPAKPSLLMGLRFNAAKGFRIEAGSVVNQFCSLDTRGGITIGASVSISPEVSIITADHDLQDAGFAGRVRGVTIEDYVFVGARATILPGVTLGEGSVVAAGAVVTKSTDPYTIVGGVPARVIGQRSRSLHYQLNYQRLFH